MTGFRTAVAFLTRIPTGVHDVSLTASVKWFPIVGLGVGALAGGVYWGAAGLLGESFGAVLAVAAAVAVTGAFHEDGLADTFDGLSSIRSRERQLEIMRDSRLGTFGVSALVLVLMARVLLVTGLDATVEAVGVLAWAHGVSRSAVVGLMTVARPAALDGSGVEYLSNLRRTRAVAVAVLVAASGWWVIGERLVGAIIGAVIGPLVIWAWAHRRIGGVTGDVLGGCQQVALVGALAVVVA